MSAFDLDVRGRELLDNEARRNPFTPDKLGPGFFEGIPQSIPMGIMRGGAYAADAMQTFGRFFDPPMSQERRDATDALAQDIRSSSVDYWTPAPGEVGTAGRVLGGLAELPLPLMAAGGNPSLLIGSEVNRVGKDLVDAGVDARTAVAVGVAQGGATAIGFKLPFLGRTLATRVASGTVGNLVTNAGTTAAQRQLLLGGGYDEIAQAYDPLDVEARAVDLLTGVAFGALAHVQMRNADRAAVIAAQNAKHFQQDTAPGTPADTVSNSLHQTALAHSIQQALRGEPVSVPDVSRATFTPRPASPAAAARPEVAEEVLGPVYDVRLTDPIVRDALAGMAEQTGQASTGGKIIRDESGEVVAKTPWEPRADWWTDRPVKLSEDESRVAVEKALAGERLGSRQSAFVDYLLGIIDENRPVPRVVPEEAPRARQPLSKEDLATESAFRTQLEDFDAAAGEYATLPDSKGGRVLNTDTARELSADYRANRSRSAAVHEPASEFVKRLYATRLKDEPSERQVPVVVFTAGGTGAGKSTGLRMLEEMDPDAALAQIVYDTNMNTLSSAVKKIEQALDADRRVKILYTLRDPVEAFTEGMLGRATRMEAEKGSGRTEHARTHSGSAKVIKQLAERYANDPRVQIDVIDNRYGKGNARPMAVEDVPDFDYNQLRESLSPILESERAAGRISEPVYAGVKGHDGRGISRVEPTAPRGGDQGTQRGDQADPVTDALLASFDENLEIPTGAIDADGNLVTARAADLLAEYEADLAQAEIQGRGVLAAVSCFLQQGA